MRWRFIAPVVVLNILPCWVQAEVLQCSDGKGDATIFRKGECQTLEDPTVPSGAPSSSPASAAAGTGKRVKGGDLPDVEALKKEFEDVKRKLLDIRDVGRHEINPVKKEEELRLTSPGPWMVSETLVPAAGEEVRGFEKSALINGHRYRLGERVDGGVIKEIARDRVVMLHDNKETVVPFNKITHPTLYGRVGTVPLTRHANGMYTLKVRINNNQEIEAMLDTGATALALPEDVVTWLLRSGTLKKSDLLGGVKAITADGSVIDSDAVQIASLRVGDMEIKDVRGLVIPASGNKGKSDSGDKKKQNDSEKEREKGDKKNKDDDQNDGKEASSEKKPDRKWIDKIVVQPLFGINELKRLGKWRIDHFNDQLIVEQ
ncbi:MAG: clan AA aspartic protease [Magnetococcales bacterium]|nr:clan AA aspartic protease [Magnetococcales bacterium]